MTDDRSPCRAVPCIEEGPETLTAVLRDDLRVQAFDEGIETGNTLLFASGLRLAALHQMKQTEEADQREEQIEGELAGAVGVKRPRDLRRHVSRLEEVGVAECSEDVAWLHPDWLEALDAEREMSGEKRAERMQRKANEWQREGHRRWLAERERGAIS